VYDAALLGLEGFTAVSALEARVDEQTHALALAVACGECAACMLQGLLQGRQPATAACPACSPLSDVCASAPGQYEVQPLHLPSQPCRTLEGAVLSVTECCERTILLRARMLGTLGCPGCYRKSGTWLVCKHLPSNIHMALGDQDPLTTRFKRDSSCMPQLIVQCCLGS
jgi:hypothetical protein